MTCPKCEKETTNGAFCGFCGARFQPVQIPEWIPQRVEEESSLGFFVKAALVLGGLYLVFAGLGAVLGGGEREDRTPEEERAAIKECVKWGGKVLYDSQDKYRDCAINGRID